MMLAIPAHLAHHFLTGRVRAIVRDVEWAGNEMMKFLQTEYRSVATPGMASEARAGEGGNAVGETQPGAAEEKR